MSQKLVLTLKSFEYYTYLFGGYTLNVLASIIY